MMPISMPIHRKEWFEDLTECAAGLTIEEVRSYGVHEELRVNEMVAHFNSLTNLPWRDCATILIEITEIRTELERGYIALKTWKKVAILAAIPDSDLAEAVESRLIGITKSLVLLNPLQAKLIETWLIE